MNSEFYVKVTNPGNPGNYCETNLRTTTNEVHYGGVDPTPSNAIVGVTIPSVKPDDAFNLFLAGLVNMEPMASISTLLFNFQGWDDGRIEDALEICANHGFTVRYAKNEYSAPEVPFNLILEDTAHLMPEAKYYMSMDDDLMVLHKSPVIAKSGGTQYLEMIHYAVHHPKCGYVSTTGVIGKYPPRNYLGPHPQKGLHMYLQTMFGALINNMGVEDGCFLPYDSLTYLGALGDALSGAYRLNSGYYTVKYNHVRAKHVGVTSIDDPDADIFGWAKEDVINNGVAKYIKENYNPEYNWKSLHIKSFTYENYENNGGIPIWEDGVTEELTWFYPPVSDEELPARHQELVDEIVQEVFR